MKLTRIRQEYSQDHLTLSNDRGSILLTCERQILAVIQSIDSLMTSTAEMDNKDKTKEYAGHDDYGNRWNLDILIRLNYMRITTRSGRISINSAKAALLLKSRLEKELMQ